MGIADRRAAAQADQDTQIKEAAKSSEIMLNWIVTQFFDKLEKQLDTLDDDLTKAVADGDLTKVKAMYDKILPVYIKATHFDFVPPTEQTQAAPAAPVPAPQPVPDPAQPTQAQPATSAAPATSAQPGKKKGVFRRLIDEMVEPTYGRNPQPPATPATPPAATNPPSSTN